jgi:hypothetical protein
MLYAILAVLGGDRRVSVVFIDRFDDYPNRPIAGRVLPLCHSPLFHVEHAVGLAKGMLPGRQRGQH